MKNGKIVQVMGPVVDVEFPDNDLPYIKDALEVDNHGKKCVMEVAQHVGNNTVRCIMLSASEGLSRDMEVVATGSGIKVPVGNQTLGRLFNVLGETIDGKEDLSDTEHWVIHREPPTFENQSPVIEILETGIKVIDLLGTLLQRVVRSVCSAVPELVRQSLSRSLSSNIASVAWWILNIHRCWRAFKRGK